MNELETIVAALQSEQCLHKKLGDGTGVVVDLRSSRVLALNTTGMFLVEELAKGTRSVDDLVEALISSFEVDRATAEGDVNGLLEDLGRQLAPPGQ